MLESETEIGKPHLLIPLWKSIPSRDNRQKCSNQLWKRTAEQEHRYSNLFLLTNLV